MLSKVQGQLTPHLPFHHWASSLRLGGEVPAPGWPSSGVGGAGPGLRQCPPRTGTVEARRVSGGGSWLGTTPAETQLPFWGHQVTDTGEVGL